MIHKDDTAVHYPHMSSIELIFILLMKVQYSFFKQRFKEVVAGRGLNIDLLIKGADVLHVAH